ncbi:MAG: UTP--glucose-1-phosphate uridylyltransferase GalU [Thermoplasmata archaeon]|nr:MAG: UTP--glucose-1-phosphate uridylyltransferase GalU [Thermoplasmata archaeon]
MKAVIPAAGLGTRLLPMTKNSPKEMLPIVDKPAIQYVVEEAVNAGIDDILIVTGRGKEVIENHFDVAYELEKILEERKEFEKLGEIRRISQLADIYYVRQHLPLGLGHAVYMARKHIGNEYFALMLGDDIILANKPCIKQLMEVHEKYKSSVIGVQKVEREKVSKYGIIEYEKVEDGVYRIMDIIEKPSMEEAPSNMAVMGRYILHPSIFSFIEKTKPGKNNEIQLTDALKAMLKEHEIYAYEFEGKRFDVGGKLDWLKINIELALKRDEFSELRKFIKDEIL